MDRSEEIVQKLDEILLSVRGLKPIFESLDKRLAIVEDSLGAVARDSAQARFNTHALNNKLQSYISTLNSLDKYLSGVLSQNNQKWG